MGRAPLLISSCLIAWLLNIPIFAVALVQGAISDIYKAHKYVFGPEAAAAAAIHAGCDINSGGVYSQHLTAAVVSGKVNSTMVDAALARAFKIRLRLGLFDPAANQTYEKYGPELVGSAAHRALSAEASRQGMTLLKNQARALPLDRGNRIAVIGPNAETKTLMAGGTGGGLLSAEVVCKGAKSATDWWCIQSPFDAIRAANGPQNLTSVSVGGSISGPANHTAVLEATAAAASADAVILLIGGDWSVEHEGMDRKTIGLPGAQLELVKAVAAAARGSGRAKQVTLPIVLYFNSSTRYNNQSPYDATSWVNTSMLPERVVRVRARLSFVAISHLKNCCTAAGPSCRGARARWVDGHLRGT